MHNNSRRLIFLLFAASLTACSGTRSVTIPNAPLRAASSEEVVIIGAVSPQRAAVAGQYSVVVASGNNSGDHEYSFDPGVRVFRHTMRGGTEFIEFHGKSDATFYPAKQVKRLTQLSAAGVHRPIEISSLPTQRNVRECQQAALSDKRTVREGIADCTDPGPCADCSGPMAPGGYLSCLITGCGGDPEDGSGSGTAIFRSVDPEVSCYFSFVDGSYTCDVNTNNTPSPAPEDLSNGYGYNDAMGAQLLHCKGPAEKSEAFVAGKNPDFGGTISLGFHIVEKGKAVAHAMVTTWRVNTAMTAQYFEVGPLFTPGRYEAWCSGAN